MSNQIKIFVDDERPIPVGYTHLFRDGESFLEWLSLNINENIYLLSLDHDLGDNKIDGYELVKRLVELNPKILKVQFHTSNFEGFKNMGYYLLNAKSSGLIQNIDEIHKHKITVLGNGDEFEEKYIRL